MYNSTKTINRHIIPTRGDWHCECFDVLSAMSLMIYNKTIHVCLSSCTAALGGELTAVASETTVHRLIVLVLPFELSASVNK